jgi:hypothetical protein
MIKRRVHSTWINRKEVRIYCIDFSGLGSDHAGLHVEIEASEEVLCQQPVDSMLVTIDLHQSEMMPEIVEFLKKYAHQEQNPIRKMVILGITGLQRVWYALAKDVTWPQSAIFLEDFEQAKDWLIAEHF